MRGRILHDTCENMHRLCTVSIPHHDLGANEGHDHHG